jgi:hypothetical protein
MIDHLRLTRKHLKIISILILIILNIVIYWNIQNHAFINYDDQLYVTSNHRIQAGITLKSVFNTFTDNHTGNWHPMTMLLHILDRDLFGDVINGLKYCTVNKKLIVNNLLSSVSIGLLK